ncbi:MAG: hypothetical protein IJ424_02570 [Oscillospiraceae bacterium]|nr:hypothetical protein [Oscillospiraceae bacterium]
MKKLFEILRMCLAIVLLAVTFVYGGIRLMKIQVVDGEKYLAMSKTSTTATQTVPAARGQIVDTNGEPLVENKVSYDVIIEYSFFPKDYESQNKIILGIAKLLQTDGIEWIDDIPITRTVPYEYTTESETEINRILNKLRLNSYATAENCIDELIKDYSISDTYSNEEKRIIAGVRYQMILSDFSSKTDYVFVKDVPIETATKIRELAHVLTGAGISETAVRVYSSGDIFPHGIGYVGPIYAEEYKELKSQGYLLTDTIGKSGIEKALESTLRGDNGEKTITVSSDGAVTEEITTQAVPGSTVMLTINAELQLKLQKILEDHITALANGTLTKQDYDFTDCSSGAAVVMDAKTGAVLAAATYPGYDINDLLSDYSAVLNAPGAPLYNRAFDGLYRPGSVMKTITAVAALSEGIIDEKSTYACHRHYNFLDIVVNCTGSHGNIGVVTAIEKSCNIFFYQVIQELGLDKFMEYQKAFGLSQDMGLEISSSKGYLASPDTFFNLGLDWTIGQVLQASIGQSEVAVTPLQMCVLATTIANKGNRLQPYLVDSVWDYNMQTMLEKTQPEVVAKVNADEDVFDTLIQGMIKAGNNTTGSTYYATNPQNEYLAQFSLDVLPYDVAIKTGTPQASNKATQNSTVVGFYPAHDPEIAFAVVIENGEYSKYTVRKIIEAYYGYESVIEDLGDGKFKNTINY